MNSNATSYFDTTQGIEKIINYRVKNCSRGEDFNINLGKGDGAAVNFYYMLRDCQLEENE